MSIKQFILKEHTLVFFFCLAALLGNCISILFANDLSQQPDCITYLGLANFDFDQSTVRRYRVLIPFVASGLNFIGAPLFNKLAPTYFTGDFSLPFSFFLVNWMLMAWFGVLIYRYCRAHQISRLASFIGILFMLSSRYTTYFAAIPLVDSLFCVVIAMTLLGLKEKNTSMLVACIFLGPFAKESFIFIAPLIFFFSHLNKTRLLMYFLLSGAIVFSYRFAYDQLFPPQHLSWLQADLDTIPKILEFSPMLFSFYGAYKILINIGLWILLPLTAMYLSKDLRQQIQKKFNLCMILFVLSVLLQMLLSGSMERMFYLTMPLMAMIMALCFEYLVKQLNFKRLG